MTITEGPLNDLTVLDRVRAVAGPMAATILGAQVFKVETPRAAGDTPRTGPTCVRPPVNRR